MLIYLVSATLFVVAGVFAGLEALGVTFPAEGWVSGMSILFVYGLGLAAIPSALWLVTVAVAVAAASRPAPPGAAPGEPSGTMEYVALGCLCLYTFAAGYSGLRWLVMKSAGPEAPAELQR